MQRTGQLLNSSESSQTLKKNKKEREKDGFLNKPMEPNDAGSE